MRDVLEAMRAWDSQGARFAVASVTSTWSSSPRPAGSIMAIREDDLLVGSVSGGCIEPAVAHIAHRVMQTGTPENAQFGPVSSEEIWEIGLTCGGHVELRVEPGWHRYITDCAIDSLDARKPGAIASFLDQATPHTAYLALPSFPESTSPYVAEVAGRMASINPVPIPIRLIIVGAAHIAAFLIAYARAADMHAVLVDPRSALLAPERFAILPNEVRCGWPQTELPALNIDSRSAVAVLGHDAKLDDPALAIALQSQAFYVGSLGSKGTLGDRHGRLAALGVAHDDLARLRSPIGLDIGAKTAQEIAASILAEIVQVYRAAK